MILRLVVLAILAGALAWLSVIVMRARQVDARRHVADLPAVPPGLRHGGAAWIVFSTPMCVGCRSVEQLLAHHRPDEQIVRVDATQEPGLAARWEVRRAPTTLHADANGTVTARLVGVEAVQRHLLGTSQAGASQTDAVMIAAARPEAS
jgi:hypothetical protein